MFPWSLFRYSKILLFILIFSGGDDIGGDGISSGEENAISKIDNMICRSKECIGKPLQVVSTQLPYVFRYLANELFAMNIRMNLNVSST